MKETPIKTVPTCAVRPGQNKMSKPISVEIRPLIPTLLRNFFEKFSENIFNTPFFSDNLIITYFGEKCP